MEDTIRVCGHGRLGQADRKAPLEALTAPCLSCQPLEIRVKEPNTQFSAVGSLLSPQETQFSLLVLTRTETNVPPGLNLCSGCGKSVAKKEEVCPYPWESPGVPGHSDSQKATPRAVGRSVWRGQMLTGLLGEILNAP